MNLTAVVAQFLVSFSIQQNLISIQNVLKETQPGELVIFPEGSVSGYSDDLAFLDEIDLCELETALDHLKTEARCRKISLWVGACYQKDGHWFNAAWGFNPDGQSYVYHKINLATHERGTFTAGTDLPVFKINMPNGVVTLGVQLCRELRFPEQWGWLARNGAQVILHLNNAIGKLHERTIWQSHLVSRAAETQRFVISANNVASEQTSPTVAIAPNGQVLSELPSDQPTFMRVNLDLSQVSNWYLNQCRTDIVEICATRRMTNANL
ncbi:MAG: carbon-nitrogen hydrolase family protein [Chloroflexi bacterium]|nr:carbon-nitrogen hydrolase family protein [Chloroflexota bacterium]